MAQLVSELHGKYAGKPILVIGGGPSVPADLARIPRDYISCVISANQHGFMQGTFAPDYVVSVDFTFGSTREPMREALRRFSDKPNINRWSWADYRLPEWTFGGDSGFTAIVVALILGGHPVLATGFDRRTGDRRYFHEPVPPKHWVGHLPASRDNMKVQNARLIALGEGHAVRPMSGPMTAFFKRWDPREVLPPAAQTPLGGQRGRLYNIVKHPAFLHPTDRLQGATVTLTDNEARGLIAAGKVRLA